MYEVTMPKLSDSMETGKIIQWRAHEGDAVHEGDVLAEVESDKAVMELECFHDGVLAGIVYGDGSEVPVGAVIAHITARGERLAEQKPGAPAAPRPAAKPAPAARPAGPAAAPAIQRSPDEELPELDISPDEADIEEASFRLKTQALRVVASKHVIPHFYVTVSADVTRLLERKDELKAKWGATVTHLVMLACLKAIEKHPEVNWSYDRGRVIKWRGIHLGLAVQAETGLTVAVLRDVQSLSPRQIVERTSALVEHARAGKLSADERRHPTFTISNLGMFEVEHFQPIINPPSSITLAVASALPAPVVVGDGIRVGRVMKLTASCDHRMIDGVTAAQFLRDLKGLLEAPEALL